MDQHIFDLGLKQSIKDSLKLGQKYFQVKLLKFLFL